MKNLSLRLTSVAAALCAAGFAQSATAADITFFGFLDQGLTYRHEDLNAEMRGPQGQGSWAPAAIDQATGHVAAAGSKSTVEQGTGNVSTWGIKGSEEIGDGTKVIFHLESGFLADDGTIYGSGNKLFERESSVGIESTTYGQLKFGRFPALSTGSGTTGIFNSRVNPFGAGWGNMTGGWKFAGTLANARYDNMINYISPKFGGLQFHAQYSFKNNSSDAEEEGSHKTDRWWAVGATYTAEQFFLAAAVDCVNYANRQSYGLNPNATTGRFGAIRSAEDAYKVTVGGHYDFQAFKLYGTAQYMKNIPWIGGYSTKEVAPMLDSAFTDKEVSQKGFDAWAVSTGVDFRAAGGTVKMSVAYAQAENQNDTGATGKDMQRANLGLGYIYPLSKRTSVYAVGGYFWQDADWQKDDISAHEVILGMMHRF